MTKRRKLRTVTLTPEQRERLKRLWFYYGNYGPKTTSGNHSFIQRLLEQGIDERSLHTKRTPKSEILTAKPFSDVILSGRTPQQEKRIAPHPSLKPQAFLRQIVHTALPLGTGVIADPFAGSGSTIAAAEAVGLSAIGPERYLDY